MNKVLVTTKELEVLLCSRGEPDTICHFCDLAMRKGIVKTNDDMDIFIHQLQQMMQQIRKDNAGDGL